MAKPDPTKDPEFQKVVRHFLNTPPQTHKLLVKSKSKNSEKPKMRSSKKVTL